MLSKIINSLEKKTLKLLFAAISKNSQHVDRPQKNSKTYSGAHATL